jgi:calcium-dependent protein kinase
VICECVGCRATCSDILQHPWLKQEGLATDKPLDNVVLGRMKKFAAMHKLKKTALMVVGSCLSAEEIAGMKRMFKTIDADGSGTITVKELQVG